MPRKLSPIALGGIAALAMLLIVGLSVAWIHGTRTPVAADSQQTPWGPNDTEVVQTETQVVVLALGGTYHLIVDQESPIPIGGAWSTEYGEISSDGVYTAPSFQPPSGVDTVWYDAGSGLLFEVHLRLHAPAGFEEEQPITLPSNFFDTANFYDGSPVPQPDLTLENTTASEPKVMPEEVQQALLDQQLANLDALSSAPEDGEWHPIALHGSATENILAPLTGLETIVPATINGQAALPVPAYTGGGYVQGVAILASSPGITEPVQKGRIGPVYPLPDYVGLECSPPGESRRVWGPLKEFKRRGPWNNNAGSIYITAELKADLWSKFKVDVTAGVTVNFARRPIDYEQIRNYDRYQCVNGIWKYAGHGTCVRFALGEETKPFWVAFIDGYPIDGGPRIWGPWSCADRP